MKDRQSWWTLATTVLAVALSASPGVAQNLVVNSTFDNDITGWDGSAGAGSFSASMGSTLAGGSGPGCLQVTNSGHNGGGEVVSQQVTGTGGVEYELAVSYYLPSDDNPANSVSVAMSWIGEYGWSTGRTWVNFSPVTDAWTRVTGTGVAPAGTTAVRVELMVVNPADAAETRDGIAYFDDVWFAEVGASTATQELFVPVAASKAGKLGTYWTSDLWVTNVVGFPVTLEGAVLPSGKDNTAAVAAPTALATVPAHGFVSLTDVVGMLGQSVTGGLYLRATAQASGLPATLVVASSRNSTPNNAGPGSFGQGMAAVGPGAKASTVAPGVYQNSAWRTNVGALNTSARTVEVDVVVRDATGTAVGSATWTLPPWGHRMVSVTDLGVTTLEGGTVLFTRTSTSGSFLGFTSIADNDSGDSVFNAAR